WNPQCCRPIEGLAGGQVGFQAGAQPVVLPAGSSMGAVGWLVGKPSAVSERGRVVVERIQEGVAGGQREAWQRARGNLDLEALDQRLPLVEGLGQLRRKELVKNEVVVAREKPRDREQRARPAQRSADVGAEVGLGCQTRVRLGNALLQIQFPESRGPEALAGIGPQLER